MLGFIFQHHASHMGLMCSNIQHAILLRIPGCAPACRAASWTHRCGNILNMWISSVEIAGLGVPGLENHGKSGTEWRFPGKSPIDDYAS